MQSFIADRKTQPKKIWEIIDVKDQFPEGTAPHRGAVVLIHQNIRSVRRSLVLAVYTGVVNSFGAEYVPISTIQVDGYKSLDSFTRPIAKPNTPPRVYDFIIGWGNSNRMIIERSRAQLFLNEVFRTQGIEEVENIVSTITSLDYDVSKDDIKLITDIFTDIS